MTGVTTNPDERALLQAAFRSFDEAAHTLQQSYSALTARVEQRRTSSTACRQRSHAHAFRRHSRVIVDGSAGGG